MTAYDDIPYSDAIVSFMNDGEIAGDNWTAKSMVEEHGKTVIATIDKATWAVYSAAPRNFWKIENGKFVKIYLPEQIEKYHRDMQTISDDRAALTEMDYKTNKWVEGIITEEEWNAIKVERQRLRDEINALEEKWGINTGVVA